MVALVATLIIVALATPGNTDLVISHETPITESDRSTAKVDYGTPEAARFNAQIFEGEDGLLCAGVLPTVLGTNGDDILAGTDGQDVINGRGGDDVINGKGADDVICGGSGDDVIFGGGGRDLIFAGTGNDHVIGGAGNDTVLADEGDDTLFGNEGRDFLSGSDGNDFMAGCTLPFEDLNDETFVTRDIFLGGRGEDIMIGDAGDDAFLAFGGDDIMIGGAGNDLLSGFSGDDFLDGGAGNDDRCQGGSGIDAHAGCETFSEIEIEGSRSVPIRP